MVASWICSLLYRSAATVQGGNYSLNSPVSPNRAGEDSCLKLLSSDNTGLGNQRSDLVVGKFCDPFCMHKILLLCFCQFLSPDSDFQVPVNYLVDQQLKKCLKYPKHYLEIEHWKLSERIFCVRNGVINWRRHNCNIYNICILINQETGESISKVILYAV